MSLKLHFLYSGLDVFSENMGDINEETGEIVYQDSLLSLTLCVFVVVFCCLFSLLLSVSGCYYCLFVVVTFFTCVNTYNDITICEYVPWKFRLTHLQMVTGFHSLTGGIFF